jgi:CRP-like cAMP-binding protein
MNDSLFNLFPLFQELTPEQNSLVRPLFSACYETAGSVLFEQGEPAERLYLIIEGEVIIRFKPEDGPAILIARVRAGGVAGWSAVLGNPFYTSSAACTTDCQTLYARGQDLRTFCEQYPDLGSLLVDRLARIVAERLRASHEHVIALLEQGIQVNEQKSLTTDKYGEY